MSRYISLTSDIDVKKVVRFIQELLRECENPQDCFLKLEIVKVNQSIDQSTLKIEYKSP